jgi:hypothetical protein
MSHHSKAAGKGLTGGLAVAPQRATCEATSLGLSNRVACQEARSDPAIIPPAQPKLGGFIIFAEKITNVLQLLLSPIGGGTGGLDPAKPVRPDLPL